MNNPVRFYVVNDGLAQFVYEESLLRQVGLLTEEAVADAFHDRGAWKAIWFHEPTAKRRAAIQSKCLTPSDTTGFRFDETKWPGAACEVMVAKWNGFPQEPSVEAYEALCLPLAEAIARAIDRLMTPNIATYPDFFAAWRRLQEASEGKPQT